MRIDPPVNVDIRWVYENEHFMVIDKPADLPVHSSGSYLWHTLETFLKRHRPGNTIHLVSRLDRETSGLVLVAKDAKTAAVLGKRKKRKLYHVLVEGIFPEGRWCAVGEIHRTNEPPVYSMRRLYHAQLLSECPETLSSDRGAATWFEAIAPGPWSNTTLLKAELVTGRTHQIRASLATLGYPVIGDKIYHTDPERFLRFREDTLTEDDKRALRLPNQALRAVELAFDDYCFKTVRPTWTAADATWEPNATTLMLL